jgi:hypothetical protein
MDNLKLDKSNKDPKTIFNPLATDITIGYTDDNDIPQSTTLKSQGFSEHPTWLADFFLDKLVEALKHEQGIHPDDKAKEEELVLEVAKEPNPAEVLSTNDKVVETPAK